jgi:hypothetical protein
VIQALPRDRPVPDFDPMCLRVIPGGRAILRAGLPVLAVVLSSLGGCARPSAARVLVATTWPVHDRRRLASEFESWAAAAHGDLEHRSLRLEWLILEPDDDLVHLAERRDPPDVLLGGAASSFARLARANQLAPIDPAGSILWCINRKASIRLSDGSFRSDRSISAIFGGQSEPNRSHRATADGPRRNAALDDPRRDQILLAAALDQLGHGHWRDGYARLVRAAGSNQLMDMINEDGADDAQRDPGDRTARESRFPRRPVDYVAMLRTARDPDAARGFLRFLTEKQGAVKAQNPEETAAGAEPAFDSLVADLVGATLVDARDELWDAWRSLARAGNPERLVRELTEPPPWPPASVARYLGRAGDKAMSLIETLAGELTPEPPARAWLLRSWLSPPRLVDDELLSELARAADGRLAHEPRFRAWLREEWTAWARQRYRRVARVAAATQAAPRGERSLAAP